MREFLLGVSLPLLLAYPVLMMKWLGGEKTVREAATSRTDAIKK